MRTPEMIESRIALLQSRTKENQRIINKLKRELRRLKGEK